MFGLDLELLNMDVKEVIEKFRKDIEKDLGVPVETFTLKHLSGKNEIVIRTGKHQKIIKGMGIAFMIKKGLKMKLKKEVLFNSIEMQCTHEETFLIFHTNEGIQTQKL